jgi:hypothetical protein
MAVKSVDRTFLQGQSFELFRAAIKSQATLDPYERYFDRFIRDFLTIQTGRIPNISEVYQEFKTYVATNKDLRIEEIVKKIFNYSKLYVKLVYAKDEDSEIVMRWKV